MRLPRRGAAVLVHAARVAASARRLALTRLRGYGMVLRDRLGRKRLPLGCLLGWDDDPLAEGLAAAGRVEQVRPGDRERPGVRYGIGELEDHPRTAEAEHDTARALDARHAEHLSRATLGVPRCDGVDDVVVTTLLRAGHPVGDLSVCETTDGILRLADERLDELRRRQLADRGRTLSREHEEQVPAARFERGSSQLGDEHRLEWERERIDAGVLDRVYEPRPYEPCLSARVGAGDKGPVGSVCKHAALESGRPGLGASEECRPELDAFGAERECRGDAAPVHDPAGEKYRNGDAIDDPGHERDAADDRVLERPEEGAAMPARLTGLSDDRVHSESLQLDDLGNRRRRAEDHAARLPYRLERQGSEREAEHRHALVSDHCELRFDQAGRRSRGNILQLWQAQLGAERREDGLHRLDPLRIGLG